MTKDDKRLLTTISKSVSTINSLLSTEPLVLQGMILGEALAAWLLRHKTENPKELHEALLEMHLGNVKTFVEIQAAEKDAGIPTRLN